LDFHNFAPSCVGGGGFWWFLSRLLVRLGTEALSRELPRLGRLQCPLLAQANFVGYNDVVASALTAPSVGGSPECLATYSKGHAELKEMMTRAEGRRPREQK